jgi:putative hydrolase
MGDFFPGMLGDLLKLLKTDAPLQWDLAVQLSQSVAADGDVERGNVDPVERMTLEELGQIAELHVADVTGMRTTPSGRPASIVALSPVEWARRSLEDWRAIFERVAVTLNAMPSAPIASEDLSGFGEEGGEGDVAAFLNQWAGAVAPAMMAMQIGSMVGHLARTSLGQYDLLLPRPDREEILVVSANIRQFANDWTLPEQDVALYLATRDIATHAVLTRPHVRARLEELIVRHAQSARPDRNALESLIGQISPGDLNDINALTDRLSSPASLDEINDTPEARQVAAELDALLGAIVGYVELVLDEVATRAIGARLPVKEAIRRRRIESRDEQHGAHALLGLHSDQDLYERGEAFVKGVIERGGRDDLATMFVIEANLPTPAEMAAPGLWLERIHLPVSEPDPDGE